MIGKVVNDWKVISFEGYNKYKLKLWLCECKCGYRQAFGVSYINANKLTCCERCRDDTRKEKLEQNFVGKKIKDWTVISFSHQNKWGSRYWNVECKCGAARKVATSYLTGSNNRSCCIVCAGQKFHEKYSSGELSDTKWNRIKRCAEGREIDFQIDKETCYQLFLKQNRKCALTGVDISFGKRAKDADNCTASLDRIDSSKPYTIDNIQWLHKEIQQMKWTFKQDYFIELCGRITMNNLYKKDGNKLVKIEPPIQLYTAKYDMVDGKPVGEPKYTPVYTKGGYDAITTTRG